MDLLPRVGKPKPALQSQLPNGDSGTHAPGSQGRTSVSFKERERLAASIVSCNSNRHAIDINLAHEPKSNRHDMTLLEGSLRGPMNLEAPARDPRDELVKLSAPNSDPPASPYTLNPPIDFDGLSWPSEL